MIQTVDHTVQRRTDVVLSSIDQTTGLLSRNGIVSMLEERILAGRQSLEPFTVFCVDIDDFRGITDRTGVRAGDQLLEHVGVSMQAAMPLGSVVGRAHGDVFVGIAHQLGFATPAAPPRASSGPSRTCDRQARPTRSRRGWVPSWSRLPTWHPTTSSPVSNSSHTSRVEILNATWCNRSQMMSRTAASFGPEKSWYQEIEDALHEQRFLVVGESLARLKGIDTVQRRELLVRLVLPGGVRVSMPRFERHAQRLGLAAAVDAWVLRRAAQVLRADANTELEVNLSLASVTNPSTIALLLELAGQDSTVAPRMLLAISERLITGSLSEVLEFTEALAGAGFRFCVDDYGLSAQGLRLLESVGARRVKLASDALHQTGSGSTDDAWLRSTIRAAQEMGVEVAVPFVTDAAVYERVRALGADFAQGVYIGPSVVVD